MVVDGDGDGGSENEIVVCVTQVWFIFLVCFTDSLVSLPKFVASPLQTFTVTHRCVCAAAVWICLAMQKPLNRLMLKLIWRFVIYEFLTCGGVWSLIRGWKLSSYISRKVCIRLQHGVCWQCKPSGVTLVDEDKSSLISSRIAPKMCLSLTRMDIPVKALL